MPIGDPVTGGPGYNNGRVFLADTDTFYQMEVSLSFSYMQLADTTGDPDVIVQSLVDHLAAWPYTASVFMEKAQSSYAEITPSDG